MTRGVAGWWPRVVLMALVVVAVTGCGRGQPVTFATVRATPATALPSAVVQPPTGHSQVRITGAVSITTTMDFQCSRAPDDFFIRGQLGVFDGVPVYLGINVEFYRKPGTYKRKTQVLVRRITPVTDGAGVYEAWYSGWATMTVNPDARSADLPPTRLVAEGLGGTATGTVRISGHFACLSVH